MLQPSKINTLIGNSFGSEGKGNVAAYIAKTEHIDICISQNGPNAGHCYIDDAGNTQIMKMLPVSGVVAKDAAIIIGSGSVIDVARLEKEILENPSVEDRLFISPTAPIVDDYCKEYEKEHLQYIASTFQGTGAAIGLKAMRSQKIKLAKDVPSLQKYIRKDIPEMLMTMLNDGATALAEVSQGIHLSVDSIWYPYCTSRPINVGQMFAYLDVPVSLVGNIIGISRSYWIRVGNVPNGQSGDIYPDSKELSWEEVSKRIGRQVLEMTTVTKRVRRVFEFSKIGFEMGVRRNGINILFLTFADYLKPNEKEEMKEYLLQESFGFEEIYFVNGFGQFDSNIERVK
jgi:adenylosuccinate synthase